MTDVSECRMFGLQVTGRNEVVTSLVACDGTHHFLVLEGTINPLNTALCDTEKCKGEESSALDPNFLDWLAQDLTGITHKV